jgi:hypothetical protein
MDPELKQYLSDMEGRIADRFARMEVRFSEKVEKSQTNLLTEFWKWARTAEARYRQTHGRSRVSMNASR